MLCLERIINLLDSFDLPIKLPSCYDISIDNIYDMMLKDKKAKDGALTLIISHKIGTVDIVEKVRKEDVLKAIKSII